ncbi:MAG TPA: hypothetical protein VGC80_17635, partial [Acetobacteraceae bacterium]
VQRINLSWPNGRTQQIRVPTAKAAAQLLPSGATVTLGDPQGVVLKPGQRIGWEVAPPFGTDMIIAVASATPLFAAPRQVNESPQAYLRDLRSAINAARGRGTAISAWARVVQLLP